jgi:hypothetical protein
VSLRGFLSFAALPLALCAADLPQRQAPLTVVHRWDEPPPAVVLPLENPSDQPLALQAVQPTDGLVVETFPPQIAPRSRGEIRLRAAPLASPTRYTSQVRVRTNRGALVYDVKHEAAPLAEFAPARLTWPTGAPSAPQTARLRLHGGVRAVRARLEPSDGRVELHPGAKAGEYTIVVTPPTNSAAPARVVIELEPQLPGVTAHLPCDFSRR